MSEVKKETAEGEAPGIYVTAAPGIYVEVKGNYEGLKDNLNKCKHIEDWAELDNLELSIRRAYESGVCGGMAWYSQALADRAEEAEREGKPKIAEALRSVRVRQSEAFPLVMMSSMRPGHAGDGYCKDLRRMHDNKGIIPRE